MPQQKPKNDYDELSREIERDVRQAVEAVGAALRGVASGAQSAFWQKTPRATWPGAGRRLRAARARPLAARPGRRHRAFVLRRSRPAVRPKKSAA